jgi:pyruvate/2-oxoglutarate/acetoin dehydrogenase E1 component
MATMTYAKALNEAFHLVMAEHPEVFQIGVGINTPWYVGQTMSGLLDKFGEGRMIDTPVSENGITGIAVGAAICGSRPILTFPRMDFMYYAMDQLCNHAAMMNFTFGGRMPIPLTIRAIINRGGEQGAQHSQALHGLFMHIPGLRVVMPATPRDAKGMLISAVEHNAPVLYIDDRWLYEVSDEVPEGYHRTPLDGAAVVSPGTDLTIITSSYLVLECGKVVDDLKAEGLSTELIDLRSIKPIDFDTIRNSVLKTGRALVVDGGWRMGGLAAEVAASISESCFGNLRKPVRRLTLPDHPAPASKVLEKRYYPNAQTIRQEARGLVD